MKNLILTGAMLLLLGATSVVAQETPKKTTQISTRTTNDTVTKKKTTKSTTKTSSPHKNGTVKKQSTTKTSTTKARSADPTKGKDSVGTTRPQ